MERRTERLVIVGASLAGLHAAETLRTEGFEGAITLIGDERALPYDRPPLSKQLLTGEWDVERLPLRSAGEFAALEIEFRSGAAATSLDTVNQLIRLTDGEAVTYGGLIIATARPRARAPIRPPARGRAHAAESLGRPAASSRS